MAKDILTTRIVTESGSIYQLRTMIRNDSTFVIRLPGPMAEFFLAGEAEKVISYRPIVEGRPFVVTVDDGYGDTPRTIISTPVKTVEVWLD